MPADPGGCSPRSLILPALEMAAWASGDVTRLVHQSDRGSNYVSLVYTDRILELGATPSVGSVGDSYDNALAETVNGLYKTELIRRRGPWRTIEQVELATLEWVWWWNNQRLHAELDYRTPAEIEAAHYADLESPEPTPVSLGTPRNQTQGDSRMDRGLVQPETPSLRHRRRLTTRVREHPSRRYRGSIQHTTRVHRTGFSPHRLGSLLGGAFRGELRGAQRAGRSGAQR